MNENNDNLSLELFPNPTMDKLYLRSNKETIQSIEIVDLFGKTIDNIKIGGNTYELDVKHLNQGSYFLKIVLDGKVIQERFSVIH